MFVVCLLEHFDFEVPAKKRFAMPFPIKFETKMMGFLPVYETKEDALADYPNAKIMEIQYEIQ